MLWIIPVMTTPILFPDMSAMWPELAEPTEAAFVTLALTVLPHGMLGIMVAAIFAASMSSVDTSFNWIAAVLTKDVFNPLSRYFRDRDPSEKVQLWFGKGSVLVLGLLAIAIALSMEKFGGAFQVYLRANSLYSPPMFIPVLLGLVYTRTPWWSGMVAFGGGVAAVLVFSVIANLAAGMPVDSFGSIFTDINLTILGIEMSRYEINTFVGIIAATLVFFGSALWFRRRPQASVIPAKAGIQKVENQDSAVLDSRLRGNDKDAGNGKISRQRAFAERIAALEHDLATPAYAEGAHVDLRGLQSYRLAGRLSMVIGIVLFVLAFPTPFFEGSYLNAVAAVLAFAIGGFTEWATRRFEASKSGQGPPLE
jgi:hypothetical protein